MPRRPRPICDNGGAVVLANAADVSALEQAAEPVYAKLEEDVQTKGFIDRIRALESEIETSATSAAAPCGRADDRAGTSVGGDDPGLLNGVWRAHPTYEEGVAAGLSEATAAEELGVQTIRMENGDYDWSWVARDGEHRCAGTYKLSGDRVVFTDPPECGSPSWDATFELAGDTITWRGVKSHQSGDPSDQTLRELLHGPWTKIADVGS